MCIRDRPHAAAYADLQQQLGALMPKWFIRDTLYAQLSHFPRYLKAAVARIDKLRACLLYTSRCV